MNKNEIKELMELISKEELEIERLKEKLKNKEEEVKFKRQRVDFLLKGGNDCLALGTTLIFEDEDKSMLEVKIVGNSKGNYDGLLMTNYKDNYDYMGEYYIFGYNCVYTDTLIEKIEDEFDWTFVGADEV